MREFYAEANAILDESEVSSAKLLKNVKYCQPDIQSRLSTL